MTQELKTKYPYITDEQWLRIDLMEANYVDFLNKEDLEALKEEKLALKEAERLAQIQLIIDSLTAQEASEEAQLIVGGTFALQDYFFHRQGATSDKMLCTPLSNTSQ